MARGKAAEPVEPVEELSREEIDAAAADPAEVEGAEPDAAEVDEAAEPVEPKPKKVKARMETFDAVRPDGTVVVVKRNIDTGEQTVTEK